MLTMIALYPSSIEKYAVAVIYILFGCTAMTLPNIWCIPLIVGLSIHCFYLFKRTPKYTGLRWQDDHTILLENQQGTTVCNLVQEESVVYPFLIVLTVRHLYIERLLLWTDSADKDLLRDLRVWLIWNK